MPRHFPDMRPALPLWARRGNKALAVISHNSLMVTVKRVATPDQRSVCADHFRSREAVAALCQLEDKTCITEVQTLPLRHKQEPPMMRVRCVDALTRDVVCNTLRTTYPFLAVWKEGAHGHQHTQPQRNTAGRPPTAQPRFSAANTTPLGPRPGGHRPANMNNQPPPAAATSSGASPGTSPPQQPTAVGTSQTARPSVPPTASKPAGHNGRSPPPPHHGSIRMHQHNAAQAKASAAAKEARQARAALDKANEKALADALKAASQATANIDINLRKTEQILARSSGAAPNLSATGPAAPPAAPCRPVPGPQPSTPDADDILMYDAGVAATAPPASPARCLDGSGDDLGSISGAAPVASALDSTLGGGAAVPGGGARAPDIGVAPIATCTQPSTWLSALFKPMQGTRPRSPSSHGAPPPATRMKPSTLQDLVPNLVAVGPPLPAGTTAPPAPSAASRAARHMAVAGEE
jgi:hypothetical protein